MEVDMEHYRNPKTERANYRSVRIHPDAYKRIREVAYQKEISLIAAVELMVKAYDDANGK
jgi:hypothetical protein